MQPRPLRPQTAEELILNMILLFYILSGVLQEQGVNVAINECMFVLRIYEFGSPFLLSARQRSRQIDQSNLFNQLRDVRSGPFSAQD